jgi:hypothetical protein
MISLFFVVYNIMLQLNKTHLTKTSYASLAILLGVILMNGLSQAKMSNENSKMVAMALFVGGWLIMPMVLSCGRPKNESWKFYLASYSILVSALVMKFQMMKNKKPEAMYGLMFMAAWLALGFFTATVGVKQSNQKTMFGLLAGVCVILSMVATLPFQRENCVVDGPGMALFALGWVFLTLVNSHRN